MRLSITRVKNRRIWDTYILNKDMSITFLQKLSFMKSHFTLCTTVGSDESSEPCLRFRDEDSDENHNFETLMYVIF